MFIVIEYKRDADTASKILSGATLKYWTVKSKAILGILRQAHKGDDIIETKHGFKVYEEGTVRKCKEQMAKLNKKLIENDLKSIIVSKQIKDRIFKVFKKKAAKIADRLEGTSALCVLNQAGLLVSWKTQNRKPY